MSIIIPAILPTSREDLDTKLRALQGITDEVQVDIVDGRFIGPATWPYLDPNENRGLDADSFSHLGNLHMEMDLMVEHPETDLKRFIAAGASRVVIHVESTRMLPTILDEFQTTYGHDKNFLPGLLSLGLAIDIATDISALEQYLDRADYVQFMGIAHIGKQGEPFDTRVLRKIQEFSRRHPGMPIQVDGGVSLDSAPLLLSSGVSRLVVGSALWNAPSLSDAYKEFNDLTERYGLYT